MKERFMNAELFVYCQSENFSPLRLDLPQTAIASPHRHYPPSSTEDLQTSFLKYLHHGAGVRFADKEWLLFTNGSDSALDLLLRAYTQRGDCIGVVAPDSPLYANLALANGRQVKAFPLSGENCDRLPAPQSLEQARVLFLSRPNSVVGSSVQWNELSDWLRAVRGMVVIDEAYAEFSAQESALTLLASHRNLMVTRSFSKAWGLAALRAGVVVGRPEAIHQIRKIALPHPLSQNTLQILGERLRSPAKIMQARERIAGLRAQIQSHLVSTGLASHVFPSETCFVSFRCHRSEAVKAAFSRQGIEIRDCTDRAAHTLSLTVREDLNANYLKHLITVASRDVL